MLMRIFHFHKNGLSLVELLILAGVIGILAALAVPSAANLIAIGRLNSANSEIDSIQEAISEYMAENDESWPGSVADLIPYLEETLGGEYEFDATTGLIKSATGWKGFNFDVATQKWVKAD